MTGFRNNEPLRQKRKQDMYKEQEIEMKLFACKEFQEVTVEEDEITQTLSRAKKAFYENAQEHNITYFEFLFRQMAYIRKRWWLCQGLVLLVLWKMLCSVQNNVYVFRGMGVLAVVFVILLIPELWKNRSHDSMEIEGTAYFSLRQIYAARMLLFAMADILMLSLFFGIVSVSVQTTIKEVLVQFFLPFNVTCCICFRLLYSRWVNSEYLAMALSLLWSVVWGWVVFNEMLYESLAMPIWAGLFIMSIVYLLFVIWQVFKKCENYWEVNPIWN